MERSVPRDGVRAGVPVVEDADGGGVGLFSRPPVNDRKAVKRVWVEERRSGVRGPSCVGGDMRRGVAVQRPLCMREEESARARARARARRTSRVPPDGTLKATG